MMLFCPKRTTVYQVIHEVIPHEGDRQVNMVDRMNRAVCRFADHIVLHNQMYCEELSKRYGLRPERVHYLALWRKYPAFTPPVHTGRVLFFGRMNPYKGIDNLLKIVRLCPELAFDVIGRVDPQVKGLVDQLQKEPNVHLCTGYVTDQEMEQAFIHADWVIVPYNSASQSGIIIDAYKYSRPVIAFDVGAISEQVSDGESGYLIRPGDHSQFAAVLRQATEMPREAYDAMCRRAYQYGNEKYSAKGAVSRFLALMQNT